DLTDRKKMEEELRCLSITDPLTDAYNRRYFMQVLEQEIERTRRTGLSFSIIMADLDHFKNVNDRFGHAAGDRVLKSLVELINARIRKIDCLARWGGEEFVILLPDTPVDKAAGLADELRERLSRTDIPGVGRVTASFGVVGYCPEDTAYSLIMRADNMLYEAKAAGRNCVRFAGACI
ncbi:MAG: GGDEF domain-containing protein, partial [Desulfotomaculales bacterium]